MKETWNKAFYIVGEDVLPVVGFIAFIVFVVLFLLSLKGGSDGTEPILMLIIMAVVTIAAFITSLLICTFIFLYLMISNYWRKTSQIG